MMKKIMIFLVVSFMFSSFYAQKIDLTNVINKVFCEKSLNSSCKKLYYHNYSKEYVTCLKKNKVQCFVLERRGSKRRMLSKMKKNKEEVEYFLKIKTTQHGDSLELNLTISRANYFNVEDNMSYVNDGEYSLFFIREEKEFVFKKIVVPGRGSILFRGFTLQ
jgi:hypothetical protein